MKTQTYAGSRGAGGFCRRTIGYDEETCANCDQPGYGEIHRACAVALARTPAEGVTVDEIDQSNVRPNAGPLIVRGIWYPCLNIGFGAPSPMSAR